MKQLSTFNSMMICLETLCIKSGEISNVAYHDARFNATRKKLFGLNTTQSLKDLISVPLDLDLDKIYRCRVLYEKNIEQVEFIPYIEKKIRHLKLVEISGDYNYTFKWADRSCFTQLLKDNADVDELIMVKNGCVTDCTIANLVFFDGKDWFTSSTPLLYGTRRVKLLDEKKIIEAEIKVKDLSKYEKIVLINAFRDLDESKAIPIAQII